MLLCRSISLLFTYKLVFDSVKAVLAEVESPALVFHVDVSVETELEAKVVSGGVRVFNGLEGVENVTAP